VHVGNPCSANQTCDEQQDLCVTPSRCGIEGGAGGWLPIALAVIGLLAARRRGWSPR
jgi:uncharacterized protein (TIGR03382 family)